MMSKSLKKPAGIYIHIPFCIRKCRYCDFFSVTAGSGEKKAYVKQLCREISLFPRAEDYQIQSIFIGGGTPSAISAEGIVDILNEIKGKFDISETAEVTIEANPGTLKEEKLLIYRENGINRLSLGLQSCNNEELRRLGRIHTYEEFLESYRLVRETGFQNVNVDLMSGLPGQKLADWEDTLQKIIALAPEHISAYGLILEEGTPLYDAYEQKSGNGRLSQDACREKSAGTVEAAEPSEPVAALESVKFPFSSDVYDRRMMETDTALEAIRYPLPSEEEERRMYYRTGELLKDAGYERYEISNYAKKGYECRHNYAYWTRQDYLGFGAGAASLMGHIRIQNPCELEAYQSEAFLDGRSFRERTVLSREDEMSEFMFLGLRTMRGVSFEKFYQEFGASMQEIYGPVIEKYRGLGLLEEKDGWLFLSAGGIDVSNVIMADFLL